MKRSELDDRDLTILAIRAAALNAKPGVRVGDYVDFANGVTRRVSHLWDWPAGEESVQTSAGGSFYLSEGVCSFSGGLDPGVPLTSLALTAEAREGAVWFFHHDYRTAHNGIHTTIPFRVWRCSLDARA